MYKNKLDSRERDRYRQEKKIKESKGTERKHTRENERKRDKEK